MLSGFTPKGTKRYETARMVRKVEDVFIPYIGQEVVGFRTQIARSRRGGAVQENQFRMIIEVVPKDQRKNSADQLIMEFEEKFKNLEGFKKLNSFIAELNKLSTTGVELTYQKYKINLTFDEIKKANLEAKVE